MVKYLKYQIILGLIKANTTLKIKNKKKIKRMCSHKKTKKNHTHHIVVKLGLNMETILLQKKMKAHQQLMK